MENNMASEKYHAVDGALEKRFTKRPCCPKMRTVVCCLIILAALLDLVCEFRWLEYFYNSTCEWFQAPLPNYGTMMEYRHKLRFFSSLSLIILTVRWQGGFASLMTGRKWNNGHVMVCLCLLCQLAAFGMEAIYNSRWIYTFGWDSRLVWELVVSIALVIVLGLYLLGRISPLLVPFFIMADWIGYLVLNIDHLGSESGSVQDMGYLAIESVWMNSYTDIVEQGIFALVMILVVIYPYTDKGHQCYIDGEASCYVSKHFLQ